ncbi:hypothetical protein [Aeromicrobium ginsengisoli]|uniref:Uncharacterized protein n=1 Tax=Aeromicrobium ginsengisoli TaxID=363867 RepID=A0A5M4FI55_9ACTN|nr:hypothetical protein [Aeromicrobium ginsengisoli]KAA1399642.1 hypothetical protein ESP70_002445 [Aeromicrobium ginsengisoli]
MSQSLTPYTGGTSEVSESPLAYVPGTAAFRARRESAELELSRQRDVVQATHQHAMEMMEARNDTLLGQVTTAGAGLIAETAIDVVANFASHADSAYRTASPIGQNLIAETVAAMAPMINNVASSHAAALRRR